MRGARQERVRERERGGRERERGESDTGSVPNEVRETQ